MEEDKQTPKQEKIVLALTAYYGSSAKIGMNDANIFQRSLDKTIESALELKKNGLDVEIVIGVDGFKGFIDKRKELLAKGVLNQKDQEELESIYEKEAQFKQTKRMIHATFTKMKQLGIERAYIKAEDKMLAGGMRNIMFAEYREKTDYLTFIDDDDYLMPEKMENFVKKIKQFRNLNSFEDLVKFDNINMSKNLNDEEYEEYQERLERLKTKTKILGFPIYSEQYKHCDIAYNCVWGCIYNMKNFDLIPMPAETVWEDRIFKLLNCDKTTYFGDNNSNFYYHSIEQGSVGKESNAPIINGNKEVNIKRFGEGRYFVCILDTIDDNTKTKIKEYLITNETTLEQILKFTENEENLYYQAIINLIPLLSNTDHKFETPSIGNLINLQKENKLNELEIKKLSYQKLQAIDIETSKKHPNNNNIPAKEFFDSLEKRKQVLKTEIEELERTGRGQSLPKLTSDSNINPETNRRKYEIVKNGVVEDKSITINTFNNRTLDKPLQEQLNKLEESTKEIMQEQLSKFEESSKEIM